MAKRKPPDVLIILDKGIPTLVRNAKKCRVEVRDYESSDCDDSRLEKDSEGVPFFPYRWRKGSVDS